ncbi:MAG: PaREP1 family protein [Methanosarcinales archaeon]
MEVDAIILPQKLSEKLKEKAEETDYLPEELAVEMLFKSLGQELDPEELVKHYQALSEKYLKDAKEFMSKGDLVQASEKLWGATALKVKMVAAKRGLKLEKHGSMWSFISKLSIESEDEDIVRFFNTANALHKNFYENEMDQRALEISAKDIEKLIEKLKRISIDL